MSLRHPGMKEHPDRTHLARLQAAGLVLLALAGALCAPTGAALAAWPANGQAICTAIYNQNEPRLAPDGAGGVIVTWQDYRPGDFDIYAQRLDADGSVRWTANGVALCTAGGDQKFPQIAADGAGGAYVIWKDFRSGAYDIYAQHLNAQGQALWEANGRLICNATGTQQDPVLVSDGADGVIMAWRDFRGGALARLYGQHLDGQGQPLWAAGGQPLFGVNGQYDTAILTDGAGGAFLVCYDYRSGAGWDIYGQRVNGAGTLLWGTNGVSLCNASGNQYYPQLISDGAGGILATWWDERAATGPDIYATRLTGAGALAGGWPANGRAICTAPWEQFSPTLTTDGANGAIISWYDQRDAIEVYAQRVLADGTVGWAADGVRLCTTAGAWPVVAPDEAGGALVAWYGTPGNTGLDISAQHVTGTGTFYSGWSATGSPVSVAPNDQYKPTILPDGSGGAFIAWTDGRSDVGDIYMSRLLPPLPNLNATLTPDGFSAPVVPRCTNDALPTNAQLTSALPGDGQPTWVNWGVATGGASVQTAWSGNVQLDGVPVSNLSVQLQSVEAGVEPQSNATSGGGFVRAVNVGPVVVRGGRHTLTSVADAGGQVSESNEADNTWSGQWVWAPPAMPRNGGQLRQAPPAVGTFALPNCDGFQFTRHPVTAWVTSLAPLNPGDDYNMNLYDDYTGSQAGFSHLCKASALAGNAVDFVVGSAAGTPTTVFPAAVRQSVSGGGGNYAVDQSDATWQKTPDGNAHWFQRPLRNRLADVYEGYFTAGQTIYFTLQRTAGPRTVMMGVSVFPSTPGYYSRSEAIATGSYLGDGTWYLAFTPPTTGWYPVVVHRLVGTDAQLPLAYNFFWGNQVSAVGEGDVARPAMEFAGAATNPVYRDTRLVFALREAGPVTLRLFDAGGRLVRTLLDGPRDAGEQFVAWDATGDDGGRVAAGVYFARFEAAGSIVTKRVTVLH